MSDDRAAVTAHEPALIKIPDQLQQARRVDQPRTSEPPSDREAGADRAGGILHELKTERAHD